MKAIRYLANWFEVNDQGQSVVKFAAGQHYPVSEESQRHVARGIAEEVEVDEPEQAPAETPAEPVADAAPAKSKGKK